MTNLLLNSLKALIVLSTSAITGSSVVIGAEPPPALMKPSSVPAAELAKRIMAVTDVILEHHIDPPTRQQMILDSIKGLYAAAGLRSPDGLSGRVSSLATREQLTALLTEVWPSSPAKPTSKEALIVAMVNGLLKSGPGEMEVMSTKDREVSEQIQGNRYVGIHIALGMDDKEKRPTISTVIEGGPAYKAGLEQGDIIEQIEEFDTKGKDLRQAVDRIRGEEGTFVTIQVRQPQSTKSRTYKVRRGTLPRSTVQGFGKAPSDGWTFPIDGANPIGYLRITEFTASTAHELRKLAVQLESRGCRALVLDLRGLSGSSVHPVVLVADSLLDGGTIGRVGTTHGEKVYEADSDAIFRGWPMVVLVDGNTNGTAEWLAAALQDQHRAVLVGAFDPAGTALEVVGGARSNLPILRTAAIERSTIPIGDGTWSIDLPTGRLERGDGRPLRGETIGNRDGRIQVPSESGHHVETASGLKPDHRVDTGHAPGTRRPVRPQSTAQEQKSAIVPDVRAEVIGDKLLRKAIDLLRESLKKV